MATGAGLAMAAQAGAALAATPRRAGPEALEFSWLGGAPALTDVGVVWGAPWPRGAMRKPAQFRLAPVDGAAAIPVQTWPMAYWPDGSIKWTGHAASGAIRAEKLRLEAGAAKVEKPLSVVTDTDAIRLTSGDFAVEIARRGPVLIRAASLGGRESLKNGRLVCLVRDTPEADAPASRTVPFEGVIEKATVEQSGPIRAVVRLDGRHRGGDRSWLPFTVRIAASAGGASLKLTHTIVFDGKEDADFICGLGVRFDVPLSDDLHNRHVRFAGEGDGLWSEAVRNLPGWAGGFALKDRFQDQLAGRPVPRLAEMEPRTRAQLETVAAWDSMKLFQSSPDHFTVRKRANAKASWVSADHGRRSSGLAYAGGVSGGVAFGLKDFWQRHPTALELTDLRSETATATVWMWSPEGGAMDLRHYDDHAHGLEMSYEDVQPGHSTPMGVARTSELMLWIRPATPSAEALVQLARTLREPPLLVAAPERYHELGLFGVWSLPDRSHPVKAKLEDQLDAALKFYLAEVDQRNWYGFWNYGDVMHTYDVDRHRWRYDVGGYAWANSELVPDLWLWYSFLRSGRADVFRMAEAMTRHTSEVDVHHLGRFAPLGSRHNVSHWGDGAKEARISQAFLRRIYYFLTADERTGDIMRLVVDADYATVANDPLRQILPKSEYPTHARSGPDWYAFAANWMIEWERTGDTRWRDKIVVGMRDITAMPHGFFSGPPFGYDPKTGHLHDIQADFKYSYHLATIFGGAEFMFELEGLLPDPAFTAAWQRFCAYYNAPEAERRRAIDDRAIDKHFSSPEWHARLTAYAARETGDPKLAARAWAELLGETRAKYQDIFPVAPKRVEAPLVLQPIEEITRVSTNHVSQWSLNVIEVLAFVGDQAPDRLPGRWAGG
jgi:hypothetical protein